MQSEPKQAPGLRGPDIRLDYPAIRKAQSLLTRLIPRPSFHDTSIETAAGDIPVRVFQPEERRNQRVILFVHGGGWVLGNVESYTRACATMADLTGSPVWSVDYRLAPEHPFPQPLDDCFAVARAVMLDPGTIGAEGPEDVVLLGDSAGGNLVAVSSLMLRDHGLALPAAQVLFYPVVQTDHDPETSPFPSVQEHATSWFPRAEDIAGFVEMYAGDHRNRWQVAPLQAPSLRDQPRTMIITAEWDVLRDEGEAYGHQLAQQGNDVRIERMDKAVHGFLSLPRFTRPVRTAYEMLDDFLNRAERE